MSEDGQALRSTLREYLGAEQTRADVLGAEPLDRARWRRLAGELGVAGVRVSESLGGVGMDLEDELVVHEELGRALSDLPVLSTVGFATAALAAAGADDELRAIASGELVVAAVLDSPVETGAGALSGTTPCVADAGDADAFVVAGHEDAGPVLAWVDAGEADVERLAALDLTRRFGRVRLDGARYRVLARGDDARRAIADGLGNGYLALAAEAVGVASRALEMTVDYVKVRRQFGRPVGGFQAVKHRCADLVVDLERARSALAFAVGAHTSGADELHRRAALAVARLHCADIPFRIADETIHLHGGIGFTWEHPAHLYYRRAKSDQLWLDPHGAQRRDLAGLVTQLYAREAANR